MILKFRGPYAFLSNFYPSIVTGPSGLVCETVEHAYQAWKSVDPQIQRRIAGAKTAVLARRKGNAVKLRSDWESMRLGVMKNLLDQKFQPGTELGNRLLETEPNEIVEGNNWHDQFWGDDGGGENWLGRLLMVRRSELYFIL